MRCLLNADGTRTCSGCRVTKPLDAFGPSKSYVGGRKPRCRQCAALGHRLWRAKRSEETNAKERERYAQKRADAEWLSNKRTKARSRYRITATQTAERRREKNRRCYANNPTAAKLAAARRKERLMSLSSDLTAPEWSAIVESFDSRCAYCQRKLSRPEVEHVIAVTRGGGLTASNVVPACLPCNRAKGNRPIWSMVNTPLAPNESR